MHAVGVVDRDTSYFIHALLLKFGYELRERGHVPFFADASEGAGRAEEDDFSTGEEFLEGRAGEACAGTPSSFDHKKAATAVTPH